MTRTNKLIRREACFACTTTYQVLGAISIVLNRKLQADIYIFDTFTGYEYFAQRLRQENIFENVYTVNYWTGLPALPFKKKLIRLAILFRLINAKQYFRKKVGHTIAYGEFYTSSRAQPKNALLRALKKSNPGIKTFWYDDGSGTYSPDSHIWISSLQYGFIEKLLGIRDDREETVLLAYSPELAKRTLNASHLKIEQMPNAVFDEKLKASLNIIFSNNEDDLSIVERFIVFDTLRLGNMDKALFSALDGIYEHIIGVFGRKNVMCKEHPRSELHSTAELSMYRNPTVPIEVVYTQQNDIENKIIISFNSTAVITPKMLFDKELVVIMLYKLVDAPWEVTAKRDERFRMLFSIYEHPEKFYVPENMKELDEILSYYSAMGIDDNVSGERK